MCRNIRPLFNFDPPATEDEVRDASLQFVRKISGFAKPSHANQAVFDRAVEDIAASAQLLLRALSTSARARNRDEVAAKARARARTRHGQSVTDWKTGRRP